MKESVRFERTTRPASDFAIEQAADDIFSILKEFESPKDAGSAFTLAHYKMIIASFPPAFRREAMEALQAHTVTIEELINEGWQ